MTSPKTPEEQAEAYLAKHPFTIAGFSRAEAGLILGGYLKAFLAGFRAGEAQMNEACAKIAHDWGYTLAVTQDQPWAAEANLALRTQNLDIEKKIRALLKPEVRG